jgi:hypothetical protein
MLDPFHLIHLETSGGPGDDGGNGGEDDDGSQEDESSKSQEDASQSQEGGDKDQIIQSLRKENASRRRKETQLSKRVEELEGASKTELEKATDKLTKQQDELNAANERARRLTVRVLAEQVGIAPEARADASVLLDWSSIEDPDDEEQVLKALEDLVKNRPYLAGSITREGADGSAGGRRTPVGDMNQRLREAAGRT